MKCRKELQVLRELRGKQCGGVQHGSKMGLEAGSFGRWMKVRNEVMIREELVLSLFM